MLSSEMCHCNACLSCHITELNSDNELKISYNKEKHETYLENNNYLIFKTIAYSTRIENLPA